MGLVGSLSGLAGSDLQITAFGCNKYYKSFTAAWLSSQRAQAPWEGRQKTPFGLFHGGILKRTSPNYKQNSYFSRTCNLDNERKFRESPAAFSAVAPLCALMDQRKEQTVKVKTGPRSGGGSGPDWDDEWMVQFWTEMETGLCG